MDLKDFTPQQLARMDIQPSKAAKPAAPAAKASKYRNVKTVIDGVVFDSAKEAHRYSQLKMWEKSGGIRYLERQPKFDLSVCSVVIGAYIGDFRYERLEPGGAWTLIVEDVKGMAGLPLYKWKVKHFNAQYGIAVTEVR